LYDLTDCHYNTYCWANRRAEQIKAHMKKIIANVAFLNRLHGTTLDARYLLCTGWRESSYNPGALGGAGERGMFQVMIDTAAGSLKAYPPKLQEFKDYSRKPEVYLRKMVNSTLAQTELSFSVLQEKAKILKNNGLNSDAIFKGHASVAVYRRLAVRYNGSGPKAEHYGQAISECLSCLRDRHGLPDVTKDFNYTSVDGCLAKAKK
jgi:hypothetical protein